MYIVPKSTLCTSVLKLCGTRRKYDSQSLSHRLYCARLAFEKTCGGSGRGKPEVVEGCVNRVENPGLSSSSSASKSPAVTLSYRLRNLASSMRLSWLAFHVRNLASSASRIAPSGSEWASSGVNVLSRGGGETDAFDRCSSILSNTDGDRWWPSLPGCGC